MRTVDLEHPADFDGWREAARGLLQAGVRPESVVWQCSQGGTADLFGLQATPAPSVHDTCSSGAPLVDTAQCGTRAGRVRVNPGFIDLARRVVCHRDPDRFALLYRLLWRQSQGERTVLSNACDDDVHRATVLGKAVGRDMHKMRAFLRFRLSPGSTVDHYHAWFEPDHHILRFNCEFFQRRFASMRWSIATPDESAHWDGTCLQFGAAVTRDALPDIEPLEALWRTYFASIFNPARLRLDAMRSEMPMKYWKNLPEASLIAPLAQQAASRTRTMVAAAPTAAPRYAAPALHQRAAPETHVEMPGTLQELAERIKHCELCDHACRATQAVPGQGSKHCEIMLVGEQPGDREDLHGRPFVGPAGQLLRAVLHEVHCDPDSLFLTNAVKHFRYRVRGKRRLHQRPTEENIAACQPWLSSEIEMVSPRVIVALGATAAGSLLGRAVRVQAERGRWIAYGEDCRLLITTHPSFVLRQPAGEPFELARCALKKDLRVATSA